MIWIQTLVTLSCRCGVGWFARLAEDQEARVQFLSAAPKIQAALAQLVEQWTENPCVRGSIPRGGTIIRRHYVLKK